MALFDVARGCGRRVALLSFIIPFPLWAQTPEWIWASPTNAPGQQTQTVYFRKTFRTPPLLWNARLSASADDGAEFFLNGMSVARCAQWDRPVRAEVSMRLNQGENVIAVRARNQTGPAGLLVQLGLGGETNLVSDASWLVSTQEEAGWTGLTFNAAGWQHAHRLGVHGIEPWASILSRGTATAAESLTLLPGFKVELLRSAGPEEGSWICLAFDEQGRLTISPEGDQRPLLRLTLREGQVAGVETIPAPLRFAMGLLYAHGSLYANARGPQGAGLYRLIDRNLNDQFDPAELQLLKRFEGGSEHGYHAVRLGPDGRLYVLNGNGTKLPKGLSPSSPHQHYAQDVLSLNPDETTEVGADAAPQCHVLRTNPEGTVWELWAGGMRNAYGFDFNSDGELLTFDSDMEWDWGTTWYRPTRILHLVPGGEYGWRDGTRTWPEDYQDSLPPVLNVGIGSPTGVRFGTKSRFPGKYRQALFAMDWSYGRILAVHLEPAGASYRAHWESFLQGTPLNLTDLDFGPDGAMYFITGGRGTQSGLYRVTHTNSQPEQAAPPADAFTATQDSARALRQQLESFIGRKDPSALVQLWPHLQSDDRFLSSAARLALEFQDLTEWKERALAETNLHAGLTALMALARVGESNDQPALIRRLGRLPGGSEEDELLRLRVLEISLLRQGRPSADLTQGIIAKLNRQYPATSWPLNRELSRLLLYLEAPGVVSKTVDLLRAARTQEEQFHYLAQLRSVRSGWTLSDRRTYLGSWLEPRTNLVRSPDLLRWFADVGRQYVDGAWVDKYLRDFRADALAQLTATERRELADLLAIPVQKARLIPSPTRGFVRQWTMADLLPDLDQLGAKRDFARGRQAFVDAQCIACHKLGNDGGPVGPDLTGAGSKYDFRSLLESMIEPSKVVADLYQNVTVRTREGDAYSGKIVRETPEQLVIETDPLAATRETVPRREVEGISPSLLSPMPEGLLNGFDRDEILDLLAYLQAGGQPDARAFR